MRGLDPYIHQKKFLELMDCRVKSGNDDLRLDVVVLGDDHL